MPRSPFPHPKHIKKRSGHETNSRHPLMLYFSVLHNFQQWVATLILHDLGLWNVFKISSWSKFASVKTISWPHPWYIHFPCHAHSWPKLFRSVASCRLRTHLISMHFSINLWGCLVKIEWRSNSQMSHSCRM